MWFIWCLWGLFKRERRWAEKGDERERRKEDGRNRLIFPSLWMTEIWLFSSVQFSRSVVSDSAIPCTAARQASLSITNSWSLLKLISIESVIPSNHLILWHPLLLLPPIPPSIRVFSSESTLRMRWPKHWSFRFSTIPSIEIPGLISFRMDWLDTNTVFKNET